MNYFSRRMSAVILAVAASLPMLTCLPTLANGKTGPTELTKYLNPFQKKGYLNKSQDRIIKKRAFKAGAMMTTDGQVATNRECGFFAIVPADKLADNDFIVNLLKDERLSGISATIPWSLIEPKEDEMNWQPIDQLLSLCQENNKTAILRISTAGVDLPATDGNATSCDTPAWVFASETKSVTFQSADGKQHVMPLFWDKSYLAKWSNFVRELASRYDKNPAIHSIGITGGGFTGGTCVLPEYPAKVASTKDNGKLVDLEDGLKSEYGMTQRQLVEHWKYVADIFPKRFKTARLNFAINPPVPHRWGEDALDEISDYLVYRYGSRVYVTRQNLSNGKHGFDDYRVLLKFRNDTLTGLQLENDTKLEDMPKIVKHALDDGISFAELPTTVLNSTDETVKTALKAFSEHIGYHLISQKVTLPEKVGVGESLQASFSFVNVGDAPAIRPERNFDKDTAGSYRVQIELRDSSGKPVLLNVHTPPMPTSQWAPGKPVNWEQELKMVDGNKHQLLPGEYTAFMSLVDTNTQRKIAFLNATSDKTVTSTDTVELGKISIVTASQAEPGKLEASSQTQNPQGRHDQ